MGLKDRNSGVTYLRLREHKYTDESGREKTKYGFAKGKDDMPYGELEGTITKLFYKDEEYEGNPLRKLVVVLSDDEDNYQFTINVESSTYANLVSFLPNIDITQPVTLHAKIDTIKRDDKEVTRRTMLVSQNEVYAKHYFTKENTHGLPAWNIAQVGKKKVVDKTDYLEFLENFIVNEVASKISGITTTKKVAAKTEAVEDDLPFGDTPTSLPWED